MKRGSESEQGGRPNRKLKTEQLRVWEGGLPPLLLNAVSTGRGQAALPNPELFNLITYLFRLSYSYLFQIRVSSA